jgi:hypothetical protein
MERLVKRLRQMLRRRALVCATVAMVMVAMAAPSATYCSTKSDGDKLVTLTEAQLDSIYVYITELETRVELLQIDLRECRELARVDAQFAEERAKMQREYYEALVKDLGRENWLRRTLGHPMVWFVVGGYLGVKAAEDN